MKLHRAWVGVSAVAIPFIASEWAVAQSERSFVELVVKADTPLQLALDERVRLRGVGQRVTGTLAEAISSYDRLVVPAGTRLWGRVAAHEKVRGGARLRANRGAISHRCAGPSSSSTPWRAGLGLPVPAASPRPPEEL